MKILSLMKDIFFRNQYSINGEKVSKKRVNLEYWKRHVNIGDALAPVIYEWMLGKNQLDENVRSGKAIHLLTIGSILAEGRIPVDAVVWGTGIHCIRGIRKLAVYHRIFKLDIRMVRGPVTKHILDCCGYRCPSLYGDPGVLMPLIYKNEKVECVPGRVVLIRHFKSADSQDITGTYPLDTRTDDYKAFIDVLCSAEKVISSSLHGIILAESYGIPAVFLQENMDNELLKYYDWYYSTGRKNIKMAYSVAEALNMVPMEVPALDEMRQTLMANFPTDLFKG